MPSSIQYFVLAYNLIYNGKEFKPYDDSYYVSADGEVFSKYKNGLLKHYIDADGYHRVDIHSKHIKIHKLVYLVWNGSIPPGLQINHYDDDKDNNNHTNLYLGTQKENISDCFKNQHRVGNKIPITILNKESNELLSYDSIKEFLLTTGHPNSNGSLRKCLNRKWFKEKYEIMERKGVTTIESYISNDIKS